MPEKHISDASRQLLATQRNVSLMRREMGAFELFFNSGRSDFGRELRDTGHMMGVMGSGLECAPLQ